MIMGEDVGRLGGVFRVTDGLQKDFGEHRVVDTPLAESGIVGTAIGLALRGYRPVCEIQFDGFVYPATDQIVSQLAKMRYRSRGQVALPVVIRIPFGGGIGAVEHHSESPEVFFAHTAGPAGGRLRRPRGRVRDDPAGHRRRRPGDLLRAQAAVLGQGRGRHRGAARATRSRSTRRASCSRGRRDPAQLRAAGPHLRRGRDRRPRGRPVHRGDRPALAVAAGHGDDRRVGRRTGRCVVAHEAPVYAGLGAEIAARVTEQCFYQLEAPVLRVGGFAIPYPPRRMEDHYLPDLDRILDAVDRTFDLLTRGAQREQGVQAPRRRGGPDRGRHRLLARQAGRHGRRINQVIVEIETAKAVVELPSPYAGTVSALLVEEGQTVDVGTPIIAVDVPGADGASRPAEPAEPPRQAEAAAAEQAAGNRPDSAGRKPRTPAGAAAGARRLRRQAGIDEPPAAEEAADAARLLPGHAVACRRQRAARPGVPRRVQLPPGIPRRRGAGRRRDGSERWPSRRCGGSPGTSASTSAALTGSGPEGSVTRDDVQQARGRRQPYRSDSRRQAPSDERHAAAHGQPAAGRRGADPGARGAQAHRRGDGGERVHRAARDRVPPGGRHRDDGRGAPGARAARVRRGQGVAAAVRGEGAAGRGAAGTP